MCVATGPVLSLAPWVVVKSSLDSEPELSPRVPIIIAHQLPLPSLLLTTCWVSLNLSEEQSNQMGGVNKMERDWVSARVPLCNLHIGSDWHGTEGFMKGNLHPTQSTSAHLLIQLGSKFIMYILKPSPRLSKMSSSRKNLWWTITWRIEQIAAAGLFFKLFVLVLFCLQLGCWAPSHIQMQTAQTKIAVTGQCHWLS